MKLARALPTLALMICLLPSSFFGTEPPPAPGPWEVLSTQAIGAQKFLSAHPQWDGRGVVIAVIDTGVDPALAGLTTTPAGAKKILDLRDFSGQGDVSLVPAIVESDLHGQGIHAGDGPWLRGLESLPVQPSEGQLFVAYLREDSLKGSDVVDLDGNGREADIFGAVVFASEGHTGEGRHIVVDTDGDGRLDDEEVRADFRTDPRWFTVGAADKREGTPAVSLALNLWKDDQDKLTFVFDDGAHGSHVAGIAAGYRIGGQDGQNGIAPGAQVISLKLGNNALSGGASTTGSMWKAWNYAARYAADNNLPLIIQMSYGVGAEAEGGAVIEKEIDRLLAADDRLVGCVSNGNEGPGLSTAGLPSCARRVLAVGAALNRSTAAHLYGVNLNSDKLFYFSSRGAEFAKPDVIAPGVASSTVPAWREGRDVMRGTSMASPQVAGAAALLLSAALAEDLPLVGSWVVQSLRRSARWIEGATVLDQGPGMVDIPAAWEVYKALASRSGAEPAFWEIETESPELEGALGPAVHWRGIAPPAPPQRQSVEITPLFRSRATESEISAFYRAFDLVSTHSWVQPAQKSLHTRGGRAMTLDLTFDTKSVAAPGLHTARILAYDKSLSRKQRQQLGPDWDLPVSVVTPLAVDPDGAVHATISGLGPAEIQRTFIHVPHTGSSLAIEAQLTGDSNQQMRVLLHDPEGRGSRLSWLGGESAPSRLTHRLANQELIPGIWELVAYADYENTSAVSARITVSHDAVIVPSGDVTLASEEGGLPQGDLHLTNRQGTTLRRQVHASITAHRITSKLSGVKELSLPIDIGPTIAEVGFRVTATEGQWGRITDLPVRLLDGDGEPVVNDGMGYSRFTTTFEVPANGAGSYTLQLLPGLADASDDAPFTVTVERTYTYRDPIALELSGPPLDPLVLYRDHEVKLHLECKTPPPALPASAAWLIDLQLNDESEDLSPTHLEVLARP